MDRLAIRFGTQSDRELCLRNAKYVAIGTIRGRLQPGLFSVARLFVDAVFPNDR